MPNIDAPRGFWPIRHASGGEIRTTRYKVTASATIYRGDPLKAVAGGTVEVCASSDDQTVLIGISSEYIVAAASGDYWCEVYDDPQIVFGVQVTTGQTPTAADVFAGSDIVTYATGSDTYFISIMELAAFGTGAKQFKCIGLIDDPDNTWAEHANVEVIFNEHLLLGARPDGI